MLSRMKFEIEPLVAEMLDQLPKNVWTSNSTTFFDPAIGGGQFVRAAGTTAQLVAKEGVYATIRLPSGEVRLVLQTCWATVGQVGNVDAINLTKGKAGRSRWLGRRPHVRGSVMNPNDHPHGGGEGKAPIGRSRPVSPWGRPALGGRTRKKNSISAKLIVRRRK